MHEPGTRIVCKEGNNKVAALSGGSITRHKGHITAGRVVEVQSGA